MHNAAHVFLCYSLKQKYLTFNIYLIKIFIMNKYKLICDDKIYTYLILCSLSHKQCLVVRQNLHACKI